MCQTKDEFQEDKLQLNLQPNGQREYPIYLRGCHLSTYKLVHLMKMHGGSTLGPNIAPFGEEGKKKLLKLQKILGSLYINHHLQELCPFKGKKES